MPDMTLLREKLQQIEESLHRIQRRSANIHSPGDFTANEDNLDKLDAIAMMLIAVGESASRKSTLKPMGSGLQNIPKSTGAASSDFVTSSLMTISISTPRRFSRFANGISPSFLIPCSACSKRSDNSRVA